jgi:CRP/FNR family transcriptional regulator
MSTFPERSRCERCPHQPLCRGTAAVDQTAGLRRRVGRHESLFRAGDPVGNQIYSIRSGSFKLEMAAPHCKPQVIGFALPPEFLGLNMLGMAVHSCSAVALEDSEVCCIEWDRQRFRGRRQPLQRDGLHLLLSAEIRREQRAILMLHHTHAEQRMAELMLTLSRRHDANGYSSTQFRLPMSRCDMASYLGVTPECVSRVIVQLRRQALLDLRRRDVTLLDPAALQRMVDGQPVRP